MINEIVNKPWEEAIINIPSQSVDLVVTDPPYGMSYQSGRRNKQHKEIENDSDLNWVPNWVSELKRVCKEDSHLYIFSSWHNIDIFKVELSKHFKVKNILIWEKNNHGSGDLEGDYAPKYEMIIFCSNGKKKLNGKRDVNILKAAKTAR